MRTLMVQYGQVAPGSRLWGLHRPERRRLGAPLERGALVGALA